VFRDPWVRANIAVTYGHQVQDGIGSQTLRMLAVYGLASSLGIGHVFRPLGCVGHIGSHVHYREAECNFTNEADRRQLNKAQRMIQLPTTAARNTSHWHSKFLPALDWTPFVRDVTDALRQQRPTLYEIERVNQLVRYYPDIFLTIPALRPASPPVRRSADTAAAGAAAAAAAATAECAAAHQQLLPQMKVSCWVTAVAVMSSCGCSSCSSSDRHDVEVCHHCVCVNMLASIHSTLATATPSV
jgi:hypothetical protein